MQSSTQSVTTNKATPNFVQARCPFCCPANSVRALLKQFRPLKNHLWGESSRANRMWGETSIGWNAHGLKCLWGELSFHLARCPWGDMSVGWKVLTPALQMHKGRYDRNIHRQDIDTNIKTRYHLRILVNSVCSVTKRHAPPISVQCVAYRQQMDIVRHKNQLCSRGGTWGNAVTPNIFRGNTVPPNNTRTRGNGDTVAFHQIGVQRNEKSR